MTFDANAKLLNFSEKLKTASGKYRVNVVTWSFLPSAFHVYAMLNLSIVCKIRPVITTLCMIEVFGTFLCVLMSVLGVFVR